MTSTKKQFKARQRHYKAWQINPLLQNRDGKPKYMKDFNNFEAFKKTKRPHEKKYKTLTLLKALQRS